jgi:hypothetical protein
MCCPDTRCPANLAVGAAAGTVFLMVIQRVAAVPPLPPTVLHGGCPPCTSPSDQHELALQVYGANVMDWETREGIEALHGVIVMGWETREGTPR